MTEKRVEITVRDKDGTRRVVDTRAKTLHRGAAFQDTGPVKVEVSKPMPMRKTRGLGQEDRKAIKAISETLTAFGFKLRLVRTTGVLTGAGKQVAFSNIADGEEAIRSVDYLWLAQRMKFDNPGQLVEYITDLICGEVTHGNF